MGIKWDSVHIGLEKKYYNLFIGEYGVNPKTKKFGLLSSSGKRTEEIISMVAHKMKCDIDRQNNADKPYVGYHVPDAGTLVLIKDGFEFSLKPKPRKIKQ